MRASSVSHWIVSICLVMVAMSALGTAEEIQMEDTAQRELSSLTSMLDRASSLDGTNDKLERMLDSEGSELGVDELEAKVADLEELTARNANELKAKGITVPDVPSSAMHKQTQSLEKELTALLATTTRPAPGGGLGAMANAHATARPSLEQTKSDSPDFAKFANGKMGKADELQALMTELGELEKHLGKPSPSSVSVSISSPQPQQSQQPYTHQQPSSESLPSSLGSLAVQPALPGGGPSAASPSFMATQQQHHDDVRNPWEESPPPAAAAVAPSTTPSSSSPSSADASASSSPSSSLAVFPVSHYSAPSSADAAAAGGVSSPNNNKMQLEDSATERFRQKEKPSTDNESENGGDEEEEEQQQQQHHKPRKASHHKHKQHEDEEEEEEEEEEELQHQQQQQPEEDARFRAVRKSFEGALNPGTDTDTVKRLAELQDQIARSAPLSASTRARFTSSNKKDLPDKVSETADGSVVLTKDQLKDIIDEALQRAGVSVPHSSSSPSSTPNPEPANSLGSEQTPTSASSDTTSTSTPSTPSTAPSSTTTNDNNNNNNKSNNNNNADNVDTTKLSSDQIAALHSNTPEATRAMAAVQATQPAAPRDNINHDPATPATPSPADAQQQRLLEKKKMDKQPHTAAGAATQKPEAHHPHREHVVPIPSTPTPMPRMVEVEKVPALIAIPPGAPRRAYLLPEVSADGHVHPPEEGISPGIPSTLDDVASGDSAAVFSRPPSNAGLDMMGGGGGQPVGYGAGAAPMMSLMQQHAAQQQQQQHASSPPQPAFYQQPQQQQPQYYPAPSASPLPPATLPFVPSSRMVTSPDINRMTTSDFLQTTQRQSFDNPLNGVDPTSPGQLMQLPQMSEAAALPPQMYETPTGFVQQPQPLQQPQPPFAGMAGYPRSIPFRGGDMSGSFLQLRSTERPSAGVAPAVPAQSLMQKRAVLTNSPTPSSAAPPSPSMGLRAPSPFLPFGAPEGSQHGPPMPVPINAYGTDPVFGRRDTVHE